MANKVFSATSSDRTGRERELLFRAIAELVKSVALAIGTVSSTGLLLAYAVALFRASKDHHLTYSFFTLASTAFQHFLLVIGCVFALVTFVAIGFMWALVRNIRDIQAVDVFLAYLHCRQKEKRISRRLSSSQSKNKPAAPFVSGVASILDFGNTMAPSLPGLTPRQKDYLALKSDWAAVGEDLQVALNELDKELTQDERGAMVGGGGKFA